MDNSVTMKILYSRADLVQIALNFDLMKALSASQKLIKGLVLAQFQKDVHVFGIFEEMFEADDVVVMKTTMDLYLRHELLLRTRLRQRGLGNDLGGRDSLSLKVCEFIALSEATLAKELAPQVFLNADVAVELDDFLFNNNLCVILLALLWLGCLLWLLHVFTFGTSCF